MKISESLSVLILALLFCSPGVMAAPEKSGYLVEGGDTVVRNSYGGCWHTGFWTPEMAIAECDPVKRTAPVIAVKTPTPPPPPVVPVAALSVRLSAQILFDFDRSVVKPEGQKILREKVVEPMKLRPAGEILTITGHADRIGSEAYNQKLSERRADAVKDYLVSQGLIAEHLVALGKGESEPDPAADTIRVCRGIRGQKLISCLQPDRRVNVETQ